MIEFIKTQLLLVYSTKRKIAWIHDNGYMDEINKYLSPIIPRSNEETIYLLYNSYELCNETDELKPFKRGKYVFCSTTNSGCQCRAKSFSEKINQPEVKLKIQTALKKGYSENSLEIKEKRKQTNLDRYGVENPFQSELVKNKSKQTNLDRYGVENPFQSELVKNKSKQTNLDRYGVEYISKSQEIKDKKRQTCIDKYGVANVGLIPSSIEKRKQTNLDRYGVYNGSMKHYTTEQQLLVGNKSILKESLKNKTYMQLASETGVSATTLANYAHHYGIREYYESSYEKIINHWLINDLNTTILNRTRKIISPYELDTVILEKNLAIEFCGLYWHSDINKDKQYHRMKYLKCKEQGFSLITIFEDEWVFNEYICKKIIKNKLGLTDLRINARMTKVVNIPWKTAQVFYEKEHISGAGSPTKLNYGLVYNDDIVAVMSFGPQRRALGSISKEKCYEIYRYATIDANIRGGASKLLTAFERNVDVKELITFADLRWGSGNLYKHLGFTFLYDTAPNYYYYKLPNLKRLHRFNFTKHNIINSGGDPTLTEYQNMINSGYSRIFDCGNGKWIKQYA